MSWSILIVTSFKYWLSIVKTFFSIETICIGTHGDFNCKAALQHLTNTSVVKYACALLNRTTFFNNILSFPTFAVDSLRWNFYKQLKQLTTPILWQMENSTIGIKPEWAWPQHFYQLKLTTKYHRPLQMSAINTFLTTNSHEWHHWTLLI